MGIGVFHFLIFVATLAREMGLQRSTVISWVLLQVFAIYLIFGNLFRFVSLGFMENSLITELVLYAVSFVAFLFFRPRSFFFLGIAVIVLLSSMIGAYHHDFQLNATLYAIRLICLLLSGWMIGKALFVVYESSLTNMCQFFENLYIQNIVLGTLMFIAFPSSQEFWLLLKTFGIDYTGDPHINRFCSMYFDPNYFAAICCIPLILNKSINRSAQGKINWKRIVLLLSLLLTASRSGIATFVLYCLGVFLYRAISLKMFVFSFKTMAFVVFGLVCSSVVVLIHSEAFLYFVERTIGMQSDPSALGRLESWWVGWDLFTEYPLSGVGYNYLHLLLLDVRGIDSSLLVTLATFGLLLTSLLICLFVCWVVSFWQKIRSVENTHPEFASMGRHLLLYLFICCVFSCHFNNLLYLQFWLVPMVALFSYLSLTLGFVKK